MSVDIRDEVLADTEVERALLGACLLSDVALEQAAATIEPGDFSSLRHKQIFAAMLTQRDRGRVDIITLSAVLDEGALPYLHELQNATPTISNAARYAERIADWRLRRDLLIASDQIAMLARGAGSTSDAADAADHARALLANLDMPTGKGAPDPDVDSYIGSIDTSYNWLIPGFLEYRDRMLVTAAEGGGKSVLLTQIGFMCAAGIHPWTHEPVDPRNVLIVDLENSPRLVSRRLNQMRRIVGNKLDPQRLRVHVRPQGLDLTTRTDRRWLIDRCRANAAELLVIGPAYRMSAGVAERGDVGGEDHARKVTKALDDIRTTCDVTLLMETHAPHAHDGKRDLRPFGSSVWLRWPEFGIGLRKSTENDDWWHFEHWRGPRDQRDWPERLEKHSGKWPWTPRLP